MPSPPSSTPLLTIRATCFSSAQRPGCTFYFEITSSSILLTHVTCNMFRSPRLANLHCFSLKLIFAWSGNVSISPFFSSHSYHFLSSPTNAAISSSSFAGVHSFIHVSSQALCLVRGVLQRAKAGTVPVFTVIMG